MVLEKIKIGTRVWFKEEKRSYKVRAFDDRYIILTKPFNLKKTVFYTIIDLKEGVRSSDDRLFCFGYKTSQQCVERLNDLRKGTSKLSKRNSIPCFVSKVKY